MRSAGRVRSQKAHAVGRGAVAKGADGRPGGCGIRFFSDSAPASRRFRPAGSGDRKRRVRESKKADSRTRSFLSQIA